MDHEDLTAYVPGTSGAPTDGIVDAGNIVGCVAIPLRFAVRDLGATTGVEVWLGDRNVFAVFAQTRHADTALADGVELFADALAAAIAPALEDEHPYDPATIAEERSPQW